MLKASDPGRREPDSGSRSRDQITGKVRANHMTMKERLKIHREIEKLNRKKLKEWKEGRK